MRNASIFLFVLLFFIGSSYSQLSTPSLPAVYKGKINTLCEINGFSIIGYIDNEERGRTNIYCDSTACWYGGIKNIYEKDLVIEGYENENNIKKISFNVCGDNLCVTIGEDTFVSGNVKILNFSIDKNDCSLLFPPEIEEEPIGMIISSPTTNKTEPVTRNETISSFITSFIEKENLYDILVKDEITLNDILNISILEEIVVNIADKEDTKKTLNRIADEVKSLITQKRNLRYEEININALTDLTIKIKVIEIMDKNGNKRIYTKIEKEIQRERKDRVIEVVPKDVASSVSEIIMIKGQIIDVIEQDPIFEIKPEEDGFSYVVKGNKTDSAVKTTTLFYSLDGSEERKQEKIIDQTGKGEERNKIFLFVFLIVVLLLIGSLVYLIYSRK